MDLATAQAHLDAWLAADLAVAGGRSVTMDGRTLTREDAATIAARIAYWQRQVEAINGRATTIRIATWTR